MIEYTAIKLWCRCGMTYRIDFYPCDDAEWQCECGAKYRIGFFLDRSEVEPDD